MTKANKAETPKARDLNEKEWAIYEHLNHLDNLMASLGVLKQYMDSEAYNRYQGVRAMDCAIDSLIRAFCDLSENLDIDI